MNANGQAIKLVNVAERMEAGEQDFSSGYHFIEAEISEAWRVFLPSGYKSVIGAESNCKNRDKFINFIVLVVRSAYSFIYRNFNF